MDFNEYQRRSRETAVYPNLGNNLWYPALGLGGESGEVCEKIIEYDRYIVKNMLVHSKVEELIKELGDVLWYASNVATESCLELEDIVEEKDSDSLQYTINFDYASMYDSLCLLGLKLSSKAGQVQEIVKKTYRDDSGKLTATKRDKIKFAIRSILCTIAQFCILIQVDMETVAERNLEKLHNRKENNTIHGSGDNR